MRKRSGEVERGSMRASEVVELRVKLSITDG